MTTSASLTQDFGIQPEPFGAGGSPGTLSDDMFEPIDQTQLRLARIQGAANPLLEAAQPLLRALAEMPQSVGSLEEVGHWRELLVREVRQFQSLCDQANLRREHVLAVRYCLCTALDEAANKAEWGGNGVWAQHSLLVTFHNEAYGGEKFFLLIGRLASNPQEHLDVLEVMYRILGLGFEGRYSVAADGRRQLETIRHRLLTLITGNHEAVPRELSPHWHGEASGRLRLLRSVPVWVTASVLGLAIFGIFAWDKYQLLTESRDVERRIVAIGRLTPAPASPLRLAQLLKDEIARGVVSVSEDSATSTVTFRGDAMFTAGQPTVNAAMTPVLDKVASEINKVSGHVTVIGHSDNQPIHSARFASNQALSEARATVVSQYLQAKGVIAGRIAAVGKGDSQPVTSNASAAGRAQNRRVEIVVAN